MKKLLADLWEETQGYYDNLVILLPKLILGLILLTAFVFLGKKIKKYSKHMLVSRMDDPLLANFLARVLQLFIVGIGFFVFLNVVGLGAAATGLLASAGVGTFMIGFAFKDIGENLIAGIMLSFKRPFKIGDLLEVNGLKGKVVSLSLRNVQIKTADGIDVFLPSSHLIKDPLQNYTIDGDLRLEFTLGIDYSSDISKALKIILGVMKNLDGIMQEKRQPSVEISNLGASALELTVYFWIDAFDPDISGVGLKNEAVEKVLIALEAAGFYLPGDILEIKNYSDSNLKALMIKPATEHQAAGD